MATSDREIATKAFSSPEWHAAADALFQATGISVSVMDFREGDLLFGTQRCSYCHLAAAVEQIGPLTCFDSCPSPDAGPGRIVCRSGLAVLYAPVVRDSRTVAHAVVSGFVTSTRERRGLYEHALNRGVGEESARRVIKALPVIARRQAESYLQMAVASARTVVDATAEKVAAVERVDELRLFVTAGQHVVQTERLDSGALGGIVEEAVALIGAEAGAILRPRGNLLEITARTEQWRGALGAHIPRAGTASGRAAESRRTVVAPGRNSAASTLAMPLMLGGRAVGVFEARLPSDSLPLSAERVSRLNRYAQFIAIALEREDERSAVERAMAGYAQLNSLAAALGGQTDIDNVAKLLTSVIEKAFTFDIAGLLVSGWGRDKADVVISGDVPSIDIVSVLEIVSGRDLEADPFSEVRYVTHKGSVVDHADSHEYAISTVPLSYGDLTVGALFVARCDGEHYSAQDAALLDGIGAHGGAAFGRAALFARIRDDYAKTIAALSASLDLGERAPAGHAGRVMQYAMLIGEELNLGVEAVEQLRFAGLLHDIGKAGIPEEILLKPSKLTPEEFLHVQSHAEKGATIVDQIEFLKALTPTILHHHERWDGTGYPHGLKGDEIPLHARILGAADAFDAMMSDRAYAKRMSMAQARAELERAAGTQFDPLVVAALLEALDKMAVAGSTGLVGLPESYGRPDLLA